MRAKPETDNQDMVEGVALLTGQERPALPVEYESDSYRYTTRNNVRARLERRESDVETLAGHNLGMLEELQEVVCLLVGTEGGDDG